MQVKHINNNRREEWNAFVAQQPSFSLLQSWEWGEFKAKLGWKVFRICVQEQDRIIAGVQMLIRLLPTGLFSIAYIPRGPIGNWLDDRIILQLFSELHRVARLHRAIFMKIEPPLFYDPAIEQTLHQYHFISSSYTNQPRATTILNLNTDLDSLFKQMRKRTQEYIKYSSRSGVTIRRGNHRDLKAFFSLMKETGKRGHFPSRSLEYYEQEWNSFTGDNQAVLFLAYFQDQLLAAHMDFCFGDHAAYFHGCSINDYKQQRPNYLLMWEAIIWAKEQGCHTYDLWGIPDEVGKSVYEGKELPVSDCKDGLWGVYQFKSGFSKNVVYYMGAYDYIYKPMLYKLITNQTLNLDTMDRFSVMIDSFSHSRKAPHAL